MALIRQPVHANDHRGRHAGRLEDPPLCGTPWPSPANTTACYRLVAGP